MFRDHWLRDMPIPAKLFGVLWIVGAVCLAASVLAMLLRV